MSTVYCERCNNKAGRFFRIKFIDGFLCGKCLKHYGKTDTVGLRLWAKQHSWKELPQYRGDVQYQGDAKSKTNVNANTNDLLICPFCHSENIQPVGQHKKGFSVGKAVGGVVLTGGIGALAGFAGKKTGQTDFVCMTCGKQFTM